MKRKSIPGIFSIILVIVLSITSSALAQASSPPAQVEEGAIDVVASDYSFSSTAGTYTEITGGTVHCTGTGSNCDDDNFNAINLGFTFTFNGIGYTQVSIQNNGFIAMGASVLSSYLPISGGTTNNIAAAFGFDLKANVGGVLRSELLGTAPNQIFVIQWKDYGAYYSTMPGDEHFDFQIRLHETSNIVEIMYGSIIKNATARSAQVGLRGASSSDFNNRMTDATHAWANSLAGVVNTSAMTLSQAVLPASGQTYLWTPLAPHPVFNTSFKSAPASVVLGNAYQYVVHIINNGTLAASSASMLDAIPASVTYHDASVLCSSGVCAYDPIGNAVTWSGSVDIGATVLVTFTVDTTAASCGETILNTAVLSDTALIGGPVSKQASTLLINALPVFSEGFENTTFPPAGWGQTQLVGASVWDRATAGTSPTISPHGGSAMARWNSYSITRGNTTRLYSPILDLSTTALPTLNFWMSHDTGSPTLKDRIQVQVSVDGGTTWSDVGNPILRYDATCTTACWKQHTIPLPSASLGDNVRFGLTAYSDYGYNIFVDDVTVGEYSTCDYLAVVPNYDGFTCPGSGVIYPLIVAQNYTSPDTVNLTLTNNWPTTLAPGSFDLGPVDAGIANVGVYVPWSTTAGSSDTATIAAAGQTSGLTAQATVKTTVPVAVGWTDLQNAPHALRQSSVVYNNSRIFVLGGYDGFPENYVDIYDITAGTWSSGTPVPVAISWWDCAAINDLIYCGGGYTTTGQSTLYIYDTVNNSWSTGTAMPAVRYSYAGVALNGKYYVIGGYSGSTYTNTIYEYDPGTNTWNSALPTMTVGRRYHMAGAIGGKIYVAGGYSGSYQNTVEIFDPAIPGWTAGPTMPTTLMNAADGVKSNRFLILAGGGLTSTSGVSNVSLVLDTVTNTWSWLPTLPRSLYAAEGDSDGNDFWMVGGYTTTYINNLTRMEPCPTCTAISGLDFTVNPAAPRPNVPAEFTASVAAGSPTIDYNWNFGDTTTGSGSPVDHTYTASGIYTVTLTATNCDGANILIATHVITVESGPLADITPSSLNSTQCPDSQTQQTLSICNDGDANLTYAITETAGILNVSQNGIESLSGSFVVFDPSVGGNTQYIPGAPQTFCFRAESFTNDWEYRYMTWLKFPNDWTVSNAYLVGTPWCQSGSNWSGFIWGWEHAPYEIVIDHRAYNQSSDHCVATYCVDVTPGVGGIDAPVSWYYDGDGYANPPHHPCSNDVYTPASMAAEPCDEAVNPQALVPEIDLTPVQWLHEYPNNGTVAPGTCTDVTVYLDSTGLAPAVYSATLEIATNDFMNPEVLIPVTMDVAGPPTNASFTFTPTSPDIGQEVTFNGTADALLPVEYTWDFGDNTTGAGQNPTHAYATFGTYTVTMTASECGGTSVFTDTVTVLPCYSLVNENFEGAFPPTGWAVQNNGGTCNWQRNDQVSPVRPNYAGGLGFAADADADRCGSGTTMNTELRTYTFDLSVVTTATLDYVASYNWYSGAEYADADISTDGGATWVNLVHWTSDHSPNGPGEPVSLNLTPYVGHPNTLVRFYYYAPGWDYWYQVDQVSVYGCYVPGAVPDIVVSPTSLTQTLQTNQTADQNFNISNQGLAFLDWQIDEGCGTPVSWLSENPISGTLPSTANENVTVAFDSTGLAVGTYNTSVCVTSNDPDTPSLPVPVTLIVTGTPNIAVTAPPLEESLCPDSVASLDISICNTGTASLNWNVADILLWLSENPITGTLPSGECNDVAVTFDSTSIAPGTYLGDLLVNSNDPDTPVVTLPVTLTVLAPPSGLDFTWTPVGPKVNETVTFTGTIGTGTTPFTWEWLFGDGSTASGQTVTHAFTTVGTYTNTLTVSNICGTTDVQHTLTVSPYQVTFIYLDLEDVVHNGEAVYIAGSFNGWNSTATPLTPNADFSVFTTAVGMSSPGSIDYKYVVYTDTLHTGPANWNWLQSNNRSAAISGDTTITDYRNVDPGWYNLQWPASFTVPAGMPSPNIYGQIWADDLTARPGAPRALMAEVGFGTTADPSTWTTWQAMTWGSQQGNNDEFVGSFTIPDTGTYSYTVRYRVNFGVGNPNDEWLYGDLNGPPFDIANTGVATVIPNEADLAVLKSTSAESVLPGETFTYTIVVSNTGPATAVNVVLTDTLPTAVSFVSASTGCAEATGKVRCDLGDLAEGNSVTVTIVVTAPAQAGTVTNTVVVTSDVPDPDTSDNTDSVAVTVESPPVTIFTTYMPIVITQP